MPTLTNGYLTASFSIGQKDSSGNFTISATLTNTGSFVTITNPRLSISMTDSAPWTRIGPSSLAPGASYSGSATISSGNTGNDTVYIYLLSFDSGSGYGGGYSVQGYVNPTPAFSKKVLSISPATITMGDTLTISDSSGVGVSSTTHTWSAGGQTGSFNTGQWTAQASVFEPLCPNDDHIDVTFTTYSSGAGGSGSSSVTIRMNVPSDYVPTCEHTYEYLPSGAMSLVGGVNQLKVTLDPDVVPYGNSATITSVELYDIVDKSSPSIPVAKTSFTQNGNEFTSSTLPTMAGVPSYTFALLFRITDSRGNVLEYKTGTFRVTNFVPPYVIINSLTRGSATTGTLDLTINSPSAKHLATVKIGNGTPIDVLNDLVQTQDGYTLSYQLTGLTSGKQYNITFTYQDTNMYNYGESPYSYTQLLSTLGMPISLFDNGTRIAVSFGEECADDYGEDKVVNFAKDAFIRFIANNVARMIKAEDLFLCPFKVGAIYQSTDDTDPGTIWPGTTWAQLKGRFLLGAGDTYSAGDTGGEASHELTIDEMPAHTHDYTYRDVETSCDETADTHSVGSNNPISGTTASAGGGQAHNNMPPYLVVYMWERTA